MQRNDEPVFVDKDGGPDPDKKRQDLQCAETATSGLNECDRSVASLSEPSKKLKASLGSAGYTDDPASVELADGVDCLVPPNHVEGCVRVASAEAPERQPNMLRVCGCDEQ